LSISLCEEVVDKSVKVVIGLFRAEKSSEGAAVLKFMA
jgi:hypothetical protein